MLKGRIELPPGPLRAPKFSPSEGPRREPESSTSQGPHIPAPVQPPQSLRERLEYWYVANNLRGGSDYGPSFEGPITLYIGAARSPCTFTVRVLVPAATEHITIPTDDRSGDYDWAPALQRQGFPSEEQLRRAVTSGRFADADVAGDAHKKCLGALKHVMATYNGMGHESQYKLENLIRRCRDKWVDPASDLDLPRLTGPPMFNISTRNDGVVEIEPSRAMWFDFSDLEPITYKQAASDDRPIVTILDRILQSFSAKRQVLEAWKRGRELAEGREDLRGAMWPRCEHAGGDGFHICCGCMGIVKCQDSTQAVDGRILCELCAED